MSIQEMAESFRQANVDGNYHKILQFEHWEKVPRDANVLAEAAVAMKAVGRFHEADYYARRSIELDAGQSVAKNMLQKFSDDERRLNHWQNSITNPRYFSAIMDYGESFDNSGRWELAVKIYKRACDIGPDELSTYQRIGDSLVKLGKPEEAESWYKRGLVLHEHPGLLFGLAEAQANSGNVRGAIVTLRKARKIGPYHEPSNVGLASYLIKLWDVSEALKVLDETLQIDPGNGRAHFYKALAYRREGNFEKMLESAQKAVGVFLRFYEKEKSQFSIQGLAASYSLVASAFRETGNVDLVIENYSNAINVNDQDYSNYYSRALAFARKCMDCNGESLEDYLKLAVDDLEMAYLHTFQIDSYHAVLASKFRRDFQYYSRNINLFKIALQINRVRDLLLYRGSHITHFTSLSTARQLILNSSPFWLSEGSFLNDPSEGTELQRFIGGLFPANSRGPLIARPFTPKFFVGSFVHESVNNDLTLWRMYGKEKMKEAEGCSLTLETQKVLDHFHSVSFFRRDVPGLGQPFTMKNMDEDFVFFWVAYRSFDDESRFVVPNLSNEQNNTLNLELEELRSMIKDFARQFADKQEDVNLLEEELNGISYLFKTADYQYEREVRIVVRAGNFEKIVEHAHEQPPKVHIETFQVDSSLTKITLGPKVEKPEAWASAFHHALEKRGCFPSIQMSSLPFR